MKRIDFIRETKEGIILFKEKAGEALKKDEANNGNLQFRNKGEIWDALGEVEKRN